MFLRIISNQVRALFFLLVLFFVTAPIDTHAAIICRAVMDRVRENGVMSLFSKYTYQRAKILDAVEILTTKSEEKERDLALDTLGKTWRNLPSSKNGEMYADIVRAIDRSPRVSADPRLLVWIGVEGWAAKGTVSQKMLAIKLTFIVQTYLDYEKSNSEPLATALLALFNMASFPGVGFEPATVALFDSIPFPLLEKMLYVAVSFPFSKIAKENMEWWEPAIRLQMRREQITPAMREYSESGAVLKLLGMIVDPYAPGNVAFDGANGYYDQRWMVQAMNSHFGKHGIENLAYILSELVDRMEFGLNHGDRASSNSEFGRREPRFVDPMARSILIILSSVASSGPSTDMVSVIKAMPQVVRNKLNSVARLTGIVEEVHSFLGGNFEVDVLRSLTMSLTKALRFNVSWRADQR